jgi:DNA topoisomerase IB
LFRCGQDARNREKQTLFRFWRTPARETAAKVFRTRGGAADAFSAVDAL